VIGPLMAVCLPSLSHVSYSRWDGLWASWWRVHRVMDSNNHAFMSGGVRSWSWEEYRTGER